MANLDPVQKFVEKYRQNYLFSAYQIWAEHRGVAEQWQGGVQNYWALSTVTDKNLFDIASLTKVVCTTSILARGVDRGIVNLDSAVESILGEFKGHALAKVTLRSLLSHSSGLKGWMPFYKNSGSGLEAWLKSQGPKLFQEKPILPTYSDVGFWVLGLVVQKIWGGIEKAFREEVQKPLGLDATQILFGPVSATEAVATEYRESLGRVICGTVFDENAEAIGDAGHAGLFATASQVGKWARAWLEARQGFSDWITPTTALLFTTSVQGSWALGWDTKSPAGSSAGTKMSAKAFGHLGYTGTSVWIDPELHGFVVLLTNRVHPSRLDERIRLFRPLFHDRIVAHWNGIHTNEEP